MKVKGEPMNIGFAVRLMGILPIATWCHTSVFIDFCENSVKPGSIIRCTYDNFIIGSPAAEFDRGGLDCRYSQFEESTSVTVFKSAICVSVNLMVRSF